jgi:hypothetical protein
MPAPSVPGRRNSTARAVLTLVLLGCDVGLVAIVGVLWNAQVQGQVSADEVSALHLLGVNAAAGVLILAVTFAAGLAGARGRGGGKLASAAWALALLRLFAVPLVAIIIAVTVGLGPSGLGGVLVAALALIDAAAALVTAGAVRRSTSG